MKLVLYSGGTDEENIVLDKKLIELSGKKNPQITFVPSSSYFIESEFMEFASQFQKYRVNNLINFPVDVEYSEILKSEVLKSDIIYLGGGNTFYFLKHLRKSGFLRELRNFVKDGGILAGLSAGAIMMTNNIATASFPEFDRDDNDENIKNLKALNLVSFDFFPHYKNSLRYDNELIEHANKTQKKLYSCPDGSGIIIDEHKIEFIGKTFVFYKGEKFSLR